MTEPLGWAERITSLEQQLTAVHQQIAALIRNSHYIYPPKAEPSKTLGEIAAEKYYDRESPQLNQNEIVTWRLTARAVAEAIIERHLFWMADIDAYRTVLAEIRAEFK